MKNEEYNVICGHISGPKFPYQIGLSYELLTARIKANKNEKFNLGLGCSGGNLVVHLINASGGNPQKLLYFSTFLESSLFLRKWIFPFIEIVPSVIGYIFYGSVYKEGHNGFEIFQEIYKNVEDDEQFEIWSGTYDVKNARAQFFCNKSENESDVNRFFFNKDQELFCSKQAIYCNNNKKKIYDSILASASIPLIMKTQFIDGVEYADGGIMYSSPLSVFVKEIFRIVSGKHEKTIIGEDIEESEENYSILLQNSFNSEKKLRLYYLMKSETAISQSTNVFSSFIKGSSILDCTSAINLLIMLCPEGIKTKKFNNINSSFLSNIILKYSSKKHYVMFLYPLGNLQLKLNNFKSKDVMKIIQDCRNNYGCQIWYSIS